MAEQIASQAGDLSEDHQHGHKKFWPLFIGCIGVVYGDIGTSPLYAFREAMHHVAHDGLNTNEVFGILSLIIWALIVIVTIKYVVLLLHADNKGEGGILSLMALVRKNVTRRKDLVLATCVIGAALFYGDAAVTPAISVTSAVEGLNLVTPAFDRYVLFISVIIICGVFALQRTGTAGISFIFGPVTIVWFLAMAAAGASWITTHPEILFSFNPYYGVLFLIEHGTISFIVLGSVFLAVTGAEALYADLGHFGKKPIQRAWLFFVFPALVTNYLGQGALVLERPETMANPFYLMVPEFLLLPMVILATCATVIACQATITGAFSLSRQAIQLGLLPRMEIRHTSEIHHGQIYMPKVNSMLMIAVLFVAILFQKSSAMAAAYGIAVCATMVITSIMTFFVVIKVWKKSLTFALLTVAPLIFVELVFLSSNMMRVFDGGFVPLLMAGYIILLTYTWVQGTRYLAKKAERQAVSLCDFAERLDRDKPHIVKGTAIFFTSDPLNAPEAFIKNIQYNQIIHEKNIILTVVTSSFPAVPENQRLHVEPISSSLMRVVVHFGFMETPDVVKALYQAKNQGFNFDVNNATFFLARRKIISDPRRGMPAWQDKIFISLSRFSIGEHDFFKLPRTRVVELGVQVAI